MFEGKYGKALTIGLIALIVIVLGVIIFFAVDFAIKSGDNSEASDAARNYVEETAKNTNTNTVENEEEEVVGLDIQVEDVNSTGASGDSTKMYKGYSMVGTIEIPKTNLNLPVLADASASAIDVSVAINGGPGLNKVGNTIIIGHNYRDGRFFANNKNLSNGDKVYITDSTGTKIEYTIYNIYVTSPEDSDFMERDTAGKREITLDTCTDDAQSRLIIWAKEN